MLFSPVPYLLPPAYAPLIVFLRPLFSKKLSLWASLKLGDQFHTPIKLQAKLEICKF